MSVRPDPRLGVDEADARGLESIDLCTEIGRPVGNVMEARPASAQEAADGGLGPERFQELDGAAERDPYALGLEHFGRGTDLPGEEFEEATCVVQGLDGDGHVVERAVGRGELIHGILRGTVGPLGERDKETIRMAESSVILEVTDQNFAEEIEAGEGLAMIDFWATWCGPCRLVEPIVEELADEYRDKGLRVCKLDVDSNPQVTTRYQVRSIPSILFFKNGELVDKVIGAVPRPHLEEKVREHL